MAWSLARRLALLSSAERSRIRQSNTAGFTGEGSARLSIMPLMHRGSTQYLLCSTTSTALIVLAPMNLNLHRFVSYVPVNALSEVFQAPTLEPDRLFSPTNWGNHD